MASRPIRKLALVALVGAAVAAAVKALRGDPAPQFSTHPTVTGGPGTEPSPPETKVSVPTPASNGAATKEGPTWVEPDDGACPDGFPVKAKLSSGIYHVPGGTAYDRTKPDRCYRSGEDAEADGLRASKR